MSKRETMKQLAVASNAARLTELGQGIETLRKARIASADQLASMLETFGAGDGGADGRTREIMSAMAQYGRKQGRHFWRTHTGSG